MNSIREHLSKVKERAHGVPALLDMIGGLASLNCTPRTELSMLEVVERIQMLNWNLGARWYQTFVDWCRATLRSGMSSSEFISKWATWCSAGDFIKDILYGFNESNIKYVLLELERRYGGNLHWKATALAPSVATNGIELEHVFAQNIDKDSHFQALGEFEAFDIHGADDFRDKILWRSGNVTWLSKSANDSLGNSAPDIKASHYVSCPGHPSKSGTNLYSNIFLTKKLGTELAGLGTNYRAYRLYIEARCGELAIFGITRFS